ncbi:MAG TPA: fibronectin type III domain-containing protein [Acidimicrobiales bacterium]|nr:fibronectin type III domain-containing protein [Acidimicrobiales bacterium]
MSSLLPAARPGAAPATAAAGPTFGTAGDVSTPLRPSSADAANALALQADGQLVLAGAAGGDFGITRLDRDHRPGARFGVVDGKVTTDFDGTDDVANAVAEAAGGRVAAAGSAGGDVAVARYEPHGVLDRSFAGDGRLTFDLGSPRDSAHAVVALPDGRIVVAGGTPSTSVAVRLLPDGNPDPSFGLGGRVAGPPGGPARAAVLQGDGKLLLAGGAGDGLVVTRHLADGAPDPEFGAAGVASVTVGAPAAAAAMIVGPDGRITIAGTRGSDVAIARLDANGSVDTTFGAGGSGAAILDLGGQESAHGLASRPDGALLVVGDAGNRGLVVRYRPDGTLDPAFGSGGYRVAGTDPIHGTHLTRFRAAVAHPESGWTVAGALRDDAMVFRVWEPAAFVLPAGATAVDFGSRFQEATDALIQPDGRILVVGELAGQVALVRYNQDGSRDPAFGVGGIVVSDRLSYPRAVTLSSGGRIVVAGGTHLGLRSVVALLAFRADGSADPSFGIDGRTTTDFGTEAHQFAEAVFALPDGALLVGLHPGTGPKLARYNPAGVLDPTFGTGGVAAFPAASAAGMVLQPDGRILARGGRRTVSRFLPDGSPDRGFGTDGSVTFAETDLLDVDVFTLQPDGRILVAGRSHYVTDDITVVRLLADGSRDPTWRRVPARYDKELVAVYPANSTPTALHVLPDGKVLVGGTVSASAGVVRLNADGTHDTGFGTGGLVVVHRSPAAPPVLVMPTVASGVVLVATAGSAFPTAGFLLLRVATGPLGAPLSVTAVPGPGAARVSWSRPAMHDESRIHAYTVTSSDGAHTVTTVDAEHLAVFVHGLMPGRTYTFRVHAVRASGDGPKSVPSNPVVVDLAAPTSAWGWNGLGQLGTGTTTGATRPVTGVGVPGVRAAAGGAYHTVALRADGTVWAWGLNTFGQLGDGTTATRPSAVRVQGLGNIVAVAAGAHHSMALASDGSVWAWGWNGVGQFGTGTTADSAVPVRVPGLAGIKAIGAGLAHSLAVRGDGSVLAWGWNILGQLGDGTRSDSRLPRPVSRLGGVKAVAGGTYHSIALRTDGTVYAWGWNGVGQLGTADTTDSLVPIPSRLMHITAIAAGAFHNYALEREGRVRSWGWNHFGQLGNGATDPSPGILDVWHLGEAVAIGAGWHHGLAVKPDGTVRTWGFNGLGQLGNGTTADSMSPVTPRVPRMAFTVAGGAFHSLSA